MPERASDDELAALIDSARSAHAPGLDPISERRMVRSALAAAERRAAASWSRSARWFLAAAAAALLVWLATAALRPPGHLTQIEVARDGLPLRLSLRTGDALVLARAAKIEVLAESPSLRRIHIKRGAVLFDVAHLKPAERFEVEAGGVLVRVRGTVFTVSVDPGRSLVQVHEGSVRIGKHVVSAGQAWASRGSSTLAASAPFKTDIEAALLARRAPQATSQRAPQAEPLASAVALPTPYTDAELKPKPKPSAGENLLDLAAAEALLRAGEATTVLKLLEGRASDDPRYALVIADALRATGNFAAALGAYEELAARTTDLMRIRTGFAAAQLAWYELHDAERSLGYVERFALDHEGSALRERASVLRIDALWALERKAEARALVERYLAREPETEASVRLRGLLVEARHGTE